MMTKIRNIVFTLLIVILLFALYSALHFYRFIHQTPLKIDSAGYLVMVPPGHSANRIVENLSTAGVLAHPKWLLWWMQVTGTRSQIKAGEYLIKPGTTPQGLVDLLVAGKVMQHAITIVEGWTFERLMQAVNEAPKLTHTLLGLSNKEIMAKLGRVGEHPEGQFFPDTYYFPANTTDLAFLQRANRVMQDKLKTAWENRENTLALKSPYEALILASIIEKESCVSEEYAEIAGVYLRRLVRNMPLQADPTVIYGLGKAFSGQLTLADLRQPSSYNTYLNIGLPPTPIALPSQKALEAATRPKEGETLYFVATGTDRRHVFSKTEEEHQKAVLRYRTVKAQIEKERSLAAQETAVIAQEEEMVAQKKAKKESEQKSKQTRLKRTPEERANAKKIVQEAKELAAAVGTPVPVTLPKGTGSPTEPKDSAKVAGNDAGNEAGTDAAKGMVKDTDKDAEDPQDTQNPQDSKQKASKKQETSKKQKSGKNAKQDKSKNKGKKGKKENKNGKNENKKGNKKESKKESKKGANQDNKIDTKKEKGSKKESKTDAKNDRQPDKKIDKKKDAKKNTKNDKKKDLKTDKKKETKKNTKKDSKKNAMNFMPLHLI